MTSQPSSQYQQTLDTLEAERASLLKDKEAQLNAIDKGIEGMQDLINLETRSVKAEASNGRSLLRASADTSNTATIERPVETKNKSAIPQPDSNVVKDTSKETERSNGSVAIAEKIESDESPVDESPVDENPDGKSSGELELEKLELPPSPACKSSVAETIVSYLKRKKSQTTLTQVVNKFYGAKERESWSKEKGQDVMTKLKAVLDKNEDSLWVANDLLNTYYILESLNENNKP